MGAYMSKPNTEKLCDNGGNEWISYGACSMQGWRTHQEDAHNCLPDFDKSKGASFFAVYDGHGGSEVARYCAEHMPKMLLNLLPNYTNKELKEALKQLFLDFDSSLTTPETRAILNTLLDTEKTENEEKKIIDSVNDIEDDDDDDDETDSELAALRSEANQPLEHVLEQYGGEEALPSSIKEILEKRRLNKVGECSSAPYKPKDLDISDENDIKLSKNIESNEKKIGGINGDTSSDINTSEQNVDELLTNSVSNSGLADEAGKENVEKDDEDDDDEDDSDESLNLDDDDSEDDDEEDEDDDNEEEDDDDDSDESEDSGADPLEFFAPGVPIDNEDTEPGVDSGSTACVALVLPIDGAVRVYVANAGDSRAVLCRGGAAIDLSVDHKPEDEDEKTRIVAAGGTVTRDGRVNGGLNLSRALGDHSYKQVPNLPLSDQMITPLPDVVEFDLIPNADEFLVIACDGVWNSMTSQEVVEFIYDRLHPNKFKKIKNQNLEEKQTESEKLSQICQEIFDHCLAPNTDGDGTGCDNMTCVIVKFSNLNGLIEHHKNNSTQASSVYGESRKRSADTSDVNTNGQIKSPKTTTPSKVAINDKDNLCTLDEHESEIDGEFSITKSKRPKVETNTADPSCSSTVSSNLSSSSSIESTQLPTNGISTE